MAIDLSHYPPLSTVTVADPKRPPNGIKNIDLTDYDEARDGEILDVMTPGTRQALAEAT